MDNDGDVDEVSKTVVFWRRQPQHAPRPTLTTQPTLSPKASPARAPETQTRSRPWYTQGWLWAMLGVILAAMAYVPIYRDKHKDLNDRIFPRTD